MEQFAWLVDQWRVQAGWRSASMECGVEFVVVIGMVIGMVCMTIPELCADSWGTMLMQEKIMVLPLDEELAQYFYTLWDVLEQSPLFWIAVIMGLTTTTLTTWTTLTTLTTTASITTVLTMMLELSVPHLSRAALMGHFVWLMDQLRVQAGWRSVSMECGEQCVVITGITMMPQLCADNWGTVSAQVEVLVSAMLPLDKGLAQYY